MILAQAVPIGIDVRSPLTWFAVAVGAIVLALTLSTRRGQSRPRPVPPGITARSPAPVAAGAAAENAPDWAVVQARFVENPPAGLAAAQTLVERAMRVRRAAGGLPAALERRVALACERAAQPDATTESRRLALLDLREILAALRDESGADPS